MNLLSAAGWIHAAVQTGISQASMPQLKHLICLHHLWLLDVFSLMFHLVPGREEGCCGRKERIAIFLATLRYLTLQMDESGLHKGNFTIICKVNLQREQSNPLGKFSHTHPEVCQPDLSEQRMTNEGDHGLIILAVHLTLLSVKWDSAESNVNA